MEVTTHDSAQSVPGMPTKYWHTLDDGRVQCDVCPRACRLREGQRGLCFVRAREGGEIVSTTYGRSSGFCVDPIEKKPLNHFLPGTPVLSFGTAGCNLACKFCQNWDMSKSREMDTLADAASPRGPWRGRLRAARLPEHRLHLQRPGGVPRVRRRRRPRPVARRASCVRSPSRRATSGAAPLAASSSRNLDAANVDLKAFSRAFLQQGDCGGQPG